MAREILTKEILLNNQRVAYNLKISGRARRIRLTVCFDGRLIMTKPENIKDEVAEKFIEKYADWVIKKINYFKNREVGSLNRLSRRDYLGKREEARAVVIERLAYFNCFYNFAYKKINIRNQKTRWGSCSRGGSLNFNFRLLYLPAPLRDYIIVHELCHLQELNHSPRFWALVAKTIPDFKALKNNLKTIG